MPLRALRRALPLAAALLIAAAAPAAAHDQLRSTNPADGAVLEAPPAQIDLTFSNEVLPLAPVVVLRDATGTDLFTAEPTVSGDVVTLPWPDDVTGPAGGPIDFTVAWRVVSSDGHPIEGSFAFSAPVPSAAPVASESAAEPATDATTPEATTPEATTTDAAALPTTTTDEPDDRTPLLLAGGTLAVLLVTALALLVRHRTRATTSTTPKDIP